MNEILQLGDPQLRQPARPVVDFSDRELQAAIELALKQLVHAGGVGIAAPQVGSPWRWCIIASHPTPRYPDAPQMSPLVMVNPQIVRQSSDCEVGWEGCLSVPGIRGRVSRSTSLTVQYQSRNGEPHLLDCEGFVARIVQHECDHLDGLVFLDRVESTNELMTEAEYRRQVLGLPGDLPV